MAAKPGERRLQILQTLASMLESPRGEKVTTAALAAKLDVSEAALYRHFASKAQMFEGLIEFVETTIFTLANKVQSSEADGVAQAEQIVSMLLGFAQNSRTQALTFAGARRIADGFARAASFNVARTDALQPTHPGSLFEGATASRASGFGVAAVWSRLRDARDRLILSLSSPLRADSGALRYAVISAVDPDTGFATTSTQTVQARPNGREKLAELRYALPLSQRSMVQFTMAARLQPDHDADAPTQKLLAVRYLASF